MKWLVVFFPAILASALEVTIEDRILGGTDAVEGQFKYQVSLRIAKKHYCAGTIINKYTVLTAAHCDIAPPGNDLTAVVGTTKLSTGGTVYNISKIIVHPNFNRTKLHNDIGMAILETPITFNQLVQPAQIPTNDIKDGDELVTSGWGYMEYPGNATENLQYLLTKVQPASECRKYRYPFYPTQLCTFAGKGAGVCSADSGGPLVKDGIVHGVVSFAFLCAIGYPDYFTRVSSYRTWILKNMK